MPIAVTINGREHKLPRPMTIQEYLEKINMAGRRIAVAKNGDVVTSQNHAHIVIQDGDVLEIVRPVGGG